MRVTPRDLGARQSGRIASEGTVNGKVLMLGLAVLSGAQAAPPAPAECVIDTLLLQGPAAFPEEVRGAVGASFDHLPKPGVAGAVEIPGALRVVYGLDTGAWAIADTFHGWDLTPASMLPEGVVSDGPAATLSGSSPSRHRLDAERLVVARALFEAMTRAKETRVDHVAAADSYDHSWTRIRRASARGRLVCDLVTTPPSTEPTYTCAITGVASLHVQVSEGFCK